MKIFRAYLETLKMILSGRASGKAPLNVAIITFASGTQRSDSTERLCIGTFEDLSARRGESGELDDQSVGRVMGRERMAERVAWGQRHNRLTL